MTWWRDGADEGVPLWWRIAWPAAWLWEHARGLAWEALNDIRLWWTLPDNATFTITPEARERLRIEHAKSKP